MKGNRIDIIEDFFDLQTIKGSVYMYQHSLKLDNEGFVYPLLFTRDASVYFYGYPRALSNYGNILLSFPAVLWALLLHTASSFTILLIFIHYVYERAKCREFIKKSGRHFDIVIQVVGTLTEPQGVNVFSGWNTGRRYIGPKNIISFLKLNGKP